MTQFCENLWVKKMSKVEALRQAQLTILRQYSPSTRKLVAAPARGLAPLEGGSSTKALTLPPLYWGAFVLSGDWK
jgi:CHAT domain-containing protein